MLIKQITLNNFRQFKGKQSLQFSLDAEKNVTVLLGDNTFGKTTILQAFNWCLYGVADFPKDSNPGFLLNLEVASEQASASQTQKCDVSVELILEHKGTEYIIMRKRPYSNQGLGNWTAAPDLLTVYYKEGGVTKQVHKGEEAKVIYGILPQSLSGYFFFDTERVSDISGKKDLSEAVKGLLGLAAVSNARKHLGERTLKTTALGQWHGSLDFKSDESAAVARQTVESKTGEKETAQKKIENAEEQLVLLNAQKERIADILRNNQSTADLQKKKQDRERDLDEAKNNLDDLNKSFLEYFSSFALVYYMLPLMDRAETVLENANVDDCGIRDMSEASIRDIIKRGRCICGAKIEHSEDGETGNDVYMHILNELRFVPPAHLGTAIGSYKELLSSDRRNIALFYTTIEEKYKQIQGCRDRIGRLETEIEDIESQIYDTEDMSTYEADMAQIKGKIKEMNTVIEENTMKIGACNSDIDHAQKILDSIVGVSDHNQRLIKYLAYAERICSWIDESYAAKEQETRDKLEERVNAIFGKMYHGERRVQIDKQYHVTLFAHVNGKEVVTGESEGLKRVKNFAFIAGLVDLAKEKATMGKSAADEVSWENEAYPLVMDAPFSNADETHIKNISAVLPEVANQVIMFVMEKDWQYARDSMGARVGKYCTLIKRSESHTEIKN